MVVRCMNLDETKTTGIRDWLLTLSEKVGLGDMHEWHSCMMQLMFEDRRTRVGDEMASRTLGFWCHEWQILDADSFLWGRSQKFSRMVFSRCSC
jgi:hypothetical protein